MNSDPWNRRKKEKNKVKEVLRALTWAEHKRPGRILSPLCPARLTQLIQITDIDRRAGGGREVWSNGMPQV